MHLEPASCIIAGMQGGLRIVAGGGGSAEDEAQVLQRFVALVGANARVLHLPWATSEPDEAAVAAWAAATLGAFGVPSVDSAAAAARSRVRLEAYEGVFITGGNTYLLLSRLRASGLDRALKEAVARGLPLYGGSAGAIVVGAHIGPCAPFDTNDCGLVDETGLDLLAGRAVWPHYQPADDDLIRAFVREWSLDVLAIDENAGVAFDGVRLERIGPGRIDVWTASGARSALG